MRPIIVSILCVLLGGCAVGNRVDSDSAVRGDSSSGLSCEYNPELFDHHIDWVAPADQDYSFVTTPDGCSIGPVLGASVEAGMYVAFRDYLALATECQNLKYRWEEINRCFVSWRIANSNYLAPIGMWP